MGANKNTQINGNTKKDKSNKFNNYHMLNSHLKVKETNKDLSAFP